MSASVHAGMQYPPDGEPPPPMENPPPEADSSIRSTSSRYASYWNAILFVTILQVKIECGTTNEIYAASEPNRCEYEFKYRTPAACASLPPPIQRDPLRDEL